MPSVFVPLSSAVNQPEPVDSGRADKPYRLRHYKIYNLSSVIKLVDL